MDRGPSCTAAASSSPWLALADDAARRYADVHGDRLFKKTVDETELAAMTKWFYGTQPEPMQTRRLDRTKQLDVEQLLLLEAVGATLSYSSRAPGRYLSCIGRI